MSRARGIAIACLAMTGPQVAAQDGLEAQSGSPPERIDLTIDTAPPDELPEECTEDQDAARIRNEIVVCAPRSGNANRLYDREQAERRHAQRTMHANDPQAPDLFGIPNHGVVVARGCFIGPCPKEPAIMIDFEALPDTPAGSDADRIARGLAPRGNSYDTGTGVEIARDTAGQHDAEELGLPPPPAQADANPTGSALPEGAL